MGRGQPDDDGRTFVSRAGRRRSDHHHLGRRSHDRRVPNHRSRRGEHDELLVLPVQRERVRTRVLLLIAGVLAIVAACVFRVKTSHTEELELRVGRTPTATYTPTRVPTP